MKKIIKRISALSLVVFMVVGCAKNESFHIPAAKGDLDTLKAELDEGRDIDSRDAAGQTALMYAAETGQMEVVKYLVSNGADVNARSKGIGRGTALIYAASSNRLVVMEYLIERGAEVNAMTQARETALFWAAANGHTEAIKILLKNGADAGLKNQNGETALDVAKQLNRNKVIELLEN